MSVPPSYGHGRSCSLVQRCRATDTIIETHDTAADDYSGHLPSPQHSDYQGGTCDRAEHPQTIGICGVGDDIKITSERFHCRWALPARQGVSTGGDAARENRLRVAAAG